MADRSPRERKSRSPVTVRKSKSPVTMRKSRSPVTMRKSKSPVTMMKSRSPVTAVRRSRSPAALALRREARNNNIDKEPPPLVDREKTCPMLLRVFCNVGRHHRPDEFTRHRVPSNELQIYTWLDCSLRELMSLIREVNPDTRPKGTLFSFSTVYPDMRRGGYRLKDLGQTLSGKRGMDDDTTLYSRKFQIGDFVDVAVTPKSRNRPY